MGTVITGDFGANKHHAPEDAKPEPTHSYQLHLKLSFSDPSIWRRLRVPGRMTLSGLHRAIQVCMGWNDQDTHQFMVGKIFYQPGFGLEDQQRKPEYDEAHFKLYQLEEGMWFIFTYLYDGGSGWEVEIDLESVVQCLEPESHPVLLDGERECPPEDVGDIHRYQTLLNVDGGVDTEAIGVDGFDPERFDVDEISRRLQAITVKK